MTRETGAPLRPIGRPRSFDRDEVMAWAKRWVQDAQDQGIDVKADPSSQSRSLLHALASLPA